MVATSDIASGEEIVSIPAHCAIDLGVRDDDPVPAALELLRELEQVVDLRGGGQSEGGASEGGGGESEEQLRVLEQANRSEGGASEGGAESDGG